MSLDVVQELISKATVILLEIHRRLMTEAIMLFNVFFDCVCVFEEGELHCKVQFSVLGDLASDKRGTE